MSEIDCIIFNEEPPEYIYNQVIPILRDKGFVNDCDIPVLQQSSGQTDQVEC